MNFFQHQEQARKKTGLLVALLCAAVLFLIAITILVIGTFLYYLNSHTDSIRIYETQATSLPQHFLQLLSSPISAWVALGVVTVVGIGCLYKFAQLRHGGKAVAEALGGHLIDPSSREAIERKALNIVEEMAIASGNPVPPLYIIEDSSINAFAAGLSRRDAIIGLTRGCIKLLDRDELQGVIAHEFSHIHNGDMRLNMRLIAILHGILLIGLIGFAIAYGSGGSRHYRRRHHNRTNGKQVSFGLALMAIGYGGTFFGNIIKAAVSRQREFLADASAVQFTRNPTGISGALKKIGGFSEGSKISSSRAAEFSHFFFGQGISTAFAALMATHPPLNQRIKRIEPRWTGTFPSVTDTPVEDKTRADANSPISHFAGTKQSTSSFSEAIIGRTGEASRESIQQAASLIHSIPEALYGAAHEASTARAVVYGLLLDSNQDVRNLQLAQLQKTAHPVSFRSLQKILTDVTTLKNCERLTLLSLCIPALKQLSKPQYEVFKKNLVSLIKADKKVSLFEWSLYRICSKNIEGTSINGQIKINKSKTEVETLLLFITAAGKNEDPLRAYNKGRAALDFPIDIKLPQQAFSLPLLDKSLNTLEKLAPLEKPKLLKALIAVINSDENVTVEEKELFRAVADTLNCPVPPFD